MGPSLRPILAGKTPQVTNSVKSRINFIQTLNVFALTSLEEKTLSYQKKNPPQINVMFSSLIILVTAILCLNLVSSRARLSERRPVDTDCRFWSPSSPPSPRSLLSITANSPSVFYWWDSNTARCLPCSRCRGSLVTLQACTILSDTKCGAGKDLEHMLGSDDESDYWEGAG